MQCQENKHKKEGKKLKLCIRQFYYWLTLETFHFFIFSAQQLIHWILIWILDEIQTFGENYQSAVVLGKQFLITFLIQNIIWIKREIIHLICKHGGFWSSVSDHVEILECTYIWTHHLKKCVFIWYVTISLFT